MNEANLLLNQEVKVTSRRSKWFGQTGIVQKIMADGRTLEVKRSKGHKGEIVFIDVSFVSEIQEPTWFAKGEPNLGPDANSVLPSNRI